MKRRHLAASALALLTAACGSTAEHATTGSFTTGGSQSLSGPAGTSPGAPGGVTGGTSNGTTTGTQSAGGSAAGTSTGATGTAGYTSQQGTSVGAARVEPGDGPGVTATTINIAAAYDPDAAAADSALGAANANPGDTKAETEAVIKYINTHGGVAHRKLNPIWYKASVSDDANTTFQRMCSTWTQDNKVFLMGAGTPILDNCTAKEHAVAVDTGAIVEETTAQNKNYPADVNITSFTIDHSMLVTINGLEKQGYFSKGAKVGIVTWDAPYYHYGISTAAAPALARLGLKNVPVQYVAVPQSYGDLGATSSSAGSAVLKFRTTGVDHVLVFDGPAGVTSSGVLWLEWAQQANSQQYYPKHGLNSTSGFNALAGDLPQKEMVGSEGVDWTPPLSATQQDWDAMPKTAQAKLCLKIMADAGQQQAGSNAQAIQMAICDALFFIKQVFDPITGPLNQQTALAAINAVGTGWRPMEAFGSDITASRHDAAYLVRNMAFLTSCNCYRYTSSTYNPY